MYQVTLADGRPYWYSTMSEVLMPVSGESTWDGLRSLKERGLVGLRSYGPNSYGHCEYVYLKPAPYVEPYCATIKEGSR